ncbi:hypothetical protein GBAR_LOCUS1530 [Geodia barretti]|uniref:Uncharacterized protein n=1 Tax=Geodia barretti TaxID=519541 RepID=A0AA35QXU1_GEOBA|nr:hypothetical protein GBAR_LOCUS1530 [Geodia barretti]
MSQDSVAVRTDAEPQTTTEVELENLEAPVHSRGSSHRCNQQDWGCTCAGQLSAELQVSTRNGSVNSSDYQLNKRH